MPPSSAPTAPNAGEQRTPHGSRLARPDGTPLETAADVAGLFGVAYGELLHALYKAPDSARYTVFEIPKRSGGKRRISAPHGLVRELQAAMLPILNEAYAAHPAAHGFVPGRSVVGNAEPHVGRRWVLNVDLEDFFPSVNFGRVRGIFMAPPFRLGAKAATVCAQIATHDNGLPQGAPTSPVLSNLAAATLDRLLTRLARDHRLTYSRYADDITLSSPHPEFPASVAYYEVVNAVAFVRVGAELEAAIARAGFRINEKKVRLQGPNVRKTVTGLTVNSRVNVERARIRRLRAMLHAWDKFGLEAAAAAHVEEHRAPGRRRPRENLGAFFRGVVYGELAFVKMVRGAEDPLFLKLAARLVGLDPNPSRFVREMAFGASDFDIFISHASEDKAEVARPIRAACEALGLKPFLDEAHIAWGESFTAKINTALGAARTVLCVVSPVSVTKAWPVEEVNAALSLEIAGEKRVLVLVVGKPDLGKLPLLRNKDFMTWTGDAAAVARRLQEVARSGQSVKAEALPSQSVPSVGGLARIERLAAGPVAKEPPDGRDGVPEGTAAQSLWRRLIRGRRE